MPSANQKSGETEALWSGQYCLFAVVSVGQFRAGFAHTYVLQDSRQYLYLFG